VASLTIAASEVFVLTHTSRYGSPYIELTDTSYIISQDYIGTVEYKGKGYFSGKSHTFKAVLSPVVPRPQCREHIIDGLWHTQSKYSSGPFSGKDFHNVEYVPKQTVDCIGGEKGGEMGEFESRKLWGLVAKGIREGDFETASREKSKIEVRMLFTFQYYVPIV
jgi:oxysterol-binding protein-related protein 9/10/11